MAIVQEINLNMIPDSAPVIVHVNQYDEGEGRFEIHLYDGNVPYVPAAGAEAIIQGTKPDGKGFDYNATLSGSTVTADVTKQMTAVAGVVRVQVVITEGDDVTGTFVFGMDVQESGLPADTDMSASEYQVVMQLLETAEGINNNPPKIGANGHWWVWDASTGAYVDSGVDASISVEIADITMLEPDATPYVENTGTDTDPIFHLFIPRGQTGNGISTISKTGTSGYVDTYTVTYTDGSTSQFEITNGRNTDQVPAIPTASAELVDTIYQYIGESTSSYTHGFYYECVNDGGVYRWVNIPVGNDPVEVSNSDPYVYRQGKGNLADMEIVGASVGWNQLVANSGTVSVTMPSGHKYLSKISGSWSISQSSGTAISSLAGGTDMIIDLTQAFNPTVADAIYAMEQATAGSGVAFFRKYFPKDYYAYDPGSIQSVCVGSRKVVGFNQWDEEWQVGGLSTNGNNNSNSDHIRGKNYYKCLPNTSYFFYYGVSGKYLRVCWYDENKTFISYQDPRNNQKLSPPNAAYFRIATASGSSTDNVPYKNNICVNISDLDRNGTYEPYTSTAYPFDSTKELRGMFSLVGGELKANGDVWRGDKIQRNWNILSNQMGAIGDTITLTGLKTNGNIICSAGLISEVGTISGTTLTLTKAISGADFVYEKATPTTEAAQPYQNPQRAYIDGTEEFTDGLTRDVMIPVGNNTTYQQDKILPSIEDYVDSITNTKADISAIAPEENGATASKAYTTGQHFYKDGKFCTAIANIASNAAFTLNTNYVEGTIAEALEAINVSGGHTIVNSSGTDMASRSKLKFANAAVTDDPANDQTIITNNPASSRQEATLEASFEKVSQDSGVYYVTRGGYCEVHIINIRPKSTGQGLLVASGLPRSMYDGIIMGGTLNFEDGTAFYVRTDNNVTNLYALIPDTNSKQGTVSYMMMN